MQNPQTKPIEQWTRQECEEYLAQYPKSLRSEAVRKRLESFQPAPKPDTHARKFEKEQQAVSNSPFTPLDLDEILHSISGFNFPPTLNPDVRGKQFENDQQADTNPSFDETLHSVFGNATRQEYSDMIDEQDAMEEKNDWWIILLSIVGVVAAIALVIGSAVVRDTSWLLAGILSILGFAIGWVSIQVLEEYF